MREGGIVSGASFEIASTVQHTSVALVLQISAIGGTTFPSSAGDPVDGDKWCIGTNEERQAKLRAAFSRVTHDGASISLVQ